MHSNPMPTGSRAGLRKYTLCSLIVDTKRKESSTNLRIVRNDTQRQ